MSHAPWHGTTGGYSSHSCRCPACRSAWRDYIWNRTRERHALMEDGVVSPQHGTLATYMNYRCRCASCRLANTEYSRLARARAMARAAS